jgi:hypothetical protein
LRRETTLDPYARGVDRTGYNPGYKSTRISMNFLKTSLIVAVAAMALGGVACGGGGDDDDDDATTTTTASARTASASPGARTSTPGTTTATSGSPAAGATTGAAGTTPVAGATGASALPTQPPANDPPPPPPTGRVYSAADAQAILNATVLTPLDLPAGWKVQTDNTADNATAALADPKGGALFERCGRLLGRTATNAPNDVVANFLASEALSFFSSITVYATEAGAADCSAEAAVRFAQPGELARAFGSVFVDPNAVQVAAFDYPQLADGSFGATLSGQVNAQGTIVDITIKIVAFREGNVTAVVGSAYSATPPTEELTPLVNLTHQRILQAIQ